MRTNIVLNDELVEEAFKYSQAKTKKDLIEEALRLFLHYKELEKKQEDYEEAYHRLLKRTSKIAIPRDSVAIIRDDRNNK